MMAIGFSRIPLAIFYLLVSALSVMGMMKKMNRVTDLIFMLPQQFVLTLSAVGAVSSIVASQFADGVVRPRAFIAADQCPAIFLAIGHTVAILSQFFADVR